jgi:hypothetical protein
MSTTAFAVDYPQRFDRIQVVLRIVIIWLAALIGIPFFWILYLGFPVVAAVLISQKGRRPLPRRRRPTSDRLAALGGRRLRLHVDPYRQAVRLGQV